MTSRESAATKMTYSFGTFLTTNVSVFANDIAMMTLKQSFDNAAAQITTLSNSIINGGDYSQEKRNAKLAMAEQAANLSGYAEVCFLMNGKTLEASQLHISATDYSRRTDVDAASLGQAVYDVLSQNMNILAPDYVKTQELSDLQNLINTYISTHGTSLSAQQSSPVNTQAFKAALKQTMDIINSIRLMARRYKTSNSLFYEQLVAESTLPTVHVHHTGLSITVKAGTTNNPVANALILLNDGKKSGTTNEQGFFGFDSVKSGTGKLTITANGFKDNITTISIAQGTDNYFDIHLENAKC